MTREEWEAKQNSLKKEYKYVPTSEQGKVEKVEITDKDGNVIPPETIKKEWNSFHDWLNSQDIKDKEVLNKGDLGNQYFRKWQKETNSPLTIESIPDVRKVIIDDINQQKDRLLKSDGSNYFTFDEKGKKVFGESARPIIDKIGWRYLENEKSKNPNYVGSLLSSYRFADSEIHQTVKGNPSASKTLTDIKSLPITSTKTIKTIQ